MNKWKSDGNEKLWTYKGYELSIKRTPAPMQHLCGYIEIKDDHPWFGQVDESITVHGGVTFSGFNGDVWRLGFDCAHFGDLMPGMVETFGDLLNQQTYRDMEFVQKECESLADQAEIAFIKETRKKISAAADLHYWQYGKNPSNFNSMLLTLLQKSDPSNRHKISKMWPELYAAWQEWNETASQDEYFARYGLPLNGNGYS
ncbi:MAG: hypothetical protein EOP04_30035 [Proteobacteria bacterium]|nr:MAG: hypothetical protein EOP04_30035 [Pseudomonadota bacterium]